MPPVPESRNRHALVVGIDVYQNLPDARLDGCVNDAREVAGVLRERFGFPSDQVSLLLDGQATREAILSAMNDLKERVKEEDVVVFHFSGHGSQMTDREDDEADGLDETILTHDTGRYIEENRDITDDELNDWLLKLSAVTPYVTVILDCCHSGGGVRGTRGAYAAPRSETAKRGKVRRVEPDLRPVEKLPPSPFGAPQVTRPRLREFKESIGAKGESGWLPPSQRFVLIAACRNNEKANEIEFNGAPHGALTWHLLQELREAPDGVTYQEILEPVARRVADEVGGAQHPQLEGARDRELFGLAWIDYPRFVPIVGIKNKRVVLGGGGAVGLLTGSTWTVHPSGTRRTEGVPPLGRLKVTEVRAATSDAVPLGEQAWNLDQAKWAIEESGCFDRPLAVALETPDGWEEKTEEMARRIDASPVLRRVSDDEAEATVTLLLPGQDRAPGLGPLSEATWTVMEKGGEVDLPPFRVAGEATAHRFVQNLEKKARYRFVLELRNPGSMLEGRVDLRIRRKGNGGSWVDVADPLGQGVREGEAVSFEIISRHDKELFVYLLDFGLTGQIELMYPLAGTREALSDGRSVEIAMEPYLPVHFPFSARPGGESRNRGTSSLKLFACTHPLDLRLLEQRGYQEERPEKQKEKPYRPREYKPLEVAEDWTTVERSVVLRRRGDSS